jgi:hypothetical protein
VPARNTVLPNHFNTSRYTAELFTSLSLLRFIPIINAALLLRAFNLELGE